MLIPAPGFGRKVGTKLILDCADYYGPQPVNVRCELNSDNETASWVPDGVCLRMDSAFYSLLDLHK